MFYFILASLFYIEFNIKTNLKINAKKKTKNSLIC